MIQIRIHGRGGQGVVTAAELIALAAFSQNWQAQAFPVFGVERTGAPIQSFARLSHEKILTKAQIYYPDIIIVQDPTLLTAKDTLKGINKKTILVVNTEKSEEEVYRLIKEKIEINNIFCAPATDIAIKTIGKNIVNTVSLGIFAKSTKLINLNSLIKAIKHKFADKDKRVVEKNCKAVKLAYNSCR